MGDAKSRPPAGGGGHGNRVAGGSWNADDRAVTALATYTALSMPRELRAH